MGFLHVAQASLKLLGSSNPPALASKALDYRLEPSREAILFNEEVKQEFKKNFLVANPLS